MYIGIRINDNKNYNNIKFRKCLIICEKMVRLVEYFLRNVCIKFGNKIIYGMEIKRFFIGNERFL